LFKLQRVARPGNVHELRLETTSCEEISRIYEAKENRVEFLLVYYTGHTPDDRRLERCLERVRVRRLLCVVDCCRADEVRLIPDKKDCSRVVLRSSERAALASPTAGSRFTRYFLAGLRSARRCPCADGVDCRRLQELRERSRSSGVVTLANLFRYTAQHMGRQKPRKEVFSYDDGNFELAFFNREPIVHSLPLVRGDRKLADVEVEEQKTVTDREVAPRF